MLKLVGYCIFVSYLTLHKKSQWIFKNWQLLILVVSVSQQFTQSKQGPFLSPSWYLGLSWLLWIGGVIIWGLICSNVWWLLLTEDLFFSMQASLRIFFLWSLWTFPDSLLMVPEWEGEHRKREPGRTIIPWPDTWKHMTSISSFPTEGGSPRSRPRSRRGEITSVFGLEMASFWRGIRDQKYCHAILGKDNLSEECFVFSIYIWTVHCNMLTMVSSVCGIYAWIYFSLYFTISFKHSFSNSEHALPL